MALWRQPCPTCCFAWGALNTRRRFGARRGGTSMSAGEGGLPGASAAVLRPRRPAAPLDAVGRPLAPPVPGRCPLRTRMSPPDARLEATPPHFPWRRSSSESWIAASPSWPMSTRSSSPTTTPTVRWGRCSPHPRRPSSPPRWTNCGSPYLQGRRTSSSPSRRLTAVCVVWWRTRKTGRDRPRPGPQGLRPSGNSPTGPVSPRPPPPAAWHANWNC
mmetsp:Transcript_31735/g.62889  ORF Transcript_31735/g.62889 Transcript_31735/m.62889 type:complete len:216 (-) Transcript_31735:295-942(-)